MDSSKGSESKVDIDRWDEAQQPWLVERMSRIRGASFSFREHSCLWRLGA